MYHYQPGTNQLALLLRNSASRQPFGFEADELDHFHTRSTMPMHLGDWYSELTSAEPITTAEKHSGTQSHRLGVRLFSPIAVTPEVSAYSFTGWIKNDEEDLEVEVTIQHDLIGPILARQTIGNTNGQWKQFECMIEDAGHTKWLFACISPKSPEVIPAVYIDDVSFGPLEQETYQHNQNGWVTKTGKLDALQHDPHTALPVDIRSSHQRTHFRYGGRGQRVLKTTLIRKEIESPQRLYIHGGNAYPLTEITQNLDITGEQPPRRGAETLYIYGPGGIVAMCEDRQTTSFLLKDHLGSLRVALNEENQPVAVFHYLPFGSLLPDNDNVPEAIKRFRYLYTGQEYDEEIGLYNYRARLYDSDLGRFLTPDPKREFPSPYVYVNNNPLSFTDPTGEMLRVFMGGRQALRATRIARRGRFFSGSRLNLSRNTGQGESWSELFSMAWRGQSEPVPHRPQISLLETVEVQGYQIKVFSSIEEAKKNLGGGPFLYKLTSVGDLNNSAKIAFGKANPTHLEVAKAHVIEPQSGVISTSTSVKAPLNRLKEWNRDAHAPVLAFIERPGWVEEPIGFKMKQINPVEGEIFTSSINVLGIVRL
jgi:RHS repeat-associated protein